MSSVNNPLNPNQLVDWTDAIVEIDNQYGFINSQNIFTPYYTADKSIVFDRIQNTITLIPQADRGAFNSTYGKDQKVEQFALAIPYFRHRDYLTVSDVQSKRRPGAADQQQTVALAKADKIQDLRLAADQTLEWLQFSAMTGVTADANGNTIADMYALFGLDKATDYTVDLATEIATTDLDAKLALVEAKVVAGLKNGSSIQGIDLWLDPALFDEIVAHPKFREVYQFYMNQGGQMLRDSLSQYYPWGVTRMFEHRGFRFLAYNPTFAVENASTGVVESKKVLGAGKGVAIPRGARDLFRGYFGPANKLDFANRPGERMYSFEFPAVDNTSITMEVEFSPLFFCTKPASIIQLG